MFKKISPLFCENAKNKTEFFRVVDADIFNYPWKFQNATGRFLQFL